MLLSCVFLGHFYVYAPGRGVLVLVLLWIGLVTAPIGLGLALIFALWIYGLTSATNRARRINEAVAAG
jgi:hypothetical protein